MLKDLNLAHVPEVAPETNFDWLQLNDLKNGRYSFGFWNVSVKNFANGQQILQHDGICKTNTFEILEQNGFCKRYREDGKCFLIRNIDNIIQSCTPIQVKDFALKLIESLPNEIEVCGFKLQKKVLKEKFLSEQIFIFKDDFLSSLKTHSAKFLADTKTVMFFPFQNGIAKVKAKGVELINYSELKDLCIWENHIIKRDFSISNSKSMFEDFIHNVSDNEQERIFSMSVAIGFLMHRYYSPTNTKAVILYDEKVTDRDSAFGGTGKGILATAISHLREVSTINGKRFDTKERFALQKVSESTEIVFLDDILPDFDFEYFNSILTDGWEFEQKNRTTIRIPFEDSPKLIISSNQIMKTKKGETASRRQFIIEFSDFYSSKLSDSQTPIIDVHGCEFFRGWDDGQWLSFDNFMLTSCSLFLEKGLPVNETKNVVYNRLLQSTCVDFCDWIFEKNFQTKNEYPFMENYTEFRDLCFGEASSFSSKSFSNWLKLFAEAGKNEYKTLRHNSITYFKLL